ncbi:MAG TPA: hypothetical protein VGJ20_13690 [Xanthobacteraceae bacterium]
MRRKECLAPSRFNLAKHRRHRPAERSDLTNGINADLKEQISHQVRRRVSIDGGCVCGLRLA